jgi:superfamily I DNA/RNA helicase
MPWYFYVLEFVSGLLLTNGVPHFVQGVCGNRFQSPFGYPPGIGESSPLSNTLWGFGRNVGRNIGLDQFLQELQLRSKEPSPKPDTVTLMTVHGAKGREFDYVYVIGLAEDVLPSYQSRQKGDKSPEMEEERRNCFVAITRAKECLVLSRADQYRAGRRLPPDF